MNLLAMAQFVQGNVGTSSDLPFAGPSTVVGATGQYLEFVNYIQQAYKAIQVEQDCWRFRTKKGVLNLLAGQNIYTLPQIQSQIADYDDISFLHFIDDARYGLIADTLTTNPLATITVGAVTQSFDTLYVTVNNISTFSPENGSGNSVLVTDGVNSINGPLQSVNGNVMGFAVEQVTVAGTATSITPGSPVTYNGSFKSPDITTQQFCFYFEYQNYRGWLDRQKLPTGKSVRFTKDPDESLEFTPVPDKAYSFFFDYKTAVDTLTQTDAATPKYMPAQYHEAICWKAIMYWSQSRENGAKWQAAKNEYDRIMNKMAVNQLPGVEFYLMDFYG